MLNNFRASTSELWSKVAASSLARLAKSGASGQARPIWDRFSHSARALRETSLLRAEHSKGPRNLHHRTIIIIDDSQVWYG
jgi:hypothetical protein